MNPPVPNNSLKKAMVTHAIPNPIAIPNASKIEWTMVFLLAGIGGFLTFGLVIGVFSLFLKTKVPSKNSDTALKNTFTTLHDIVECQKSERRVK